MSIKELISHTEYMRDCFRSVWGKIYNRIFIMQHGISFDETTCVAEDWEFNLRIYNHAKYVGIAKENGYVYHFGNDGSLLNEYHHEFLKRHLLCIELEKALPVLTKFSDDFLDHVSLSLWFHLTLASIVSILGS